MKQMCVGFFFYFYSFSSFSDLNIFFRYAFLLDMYCFVEISPSLHSIVLFLFGFYFDLIVPFTISRRGRTLCSLSWLGSPLGATVSLLLRWKNWYNLDNLTWLFECQHSKEMDPHSKTTDNRQAVSRLSNFDANNCLDLISSCLKKCTLHDIFIPFNIKKCFFLKL